MLCDTNGGMLPSQVTAAIDDLTDRLGRSTPDRLGIHCQNDTACAVANTIAAVEAGVEHVQGTANGYGERPGNADIFAVVANLQLKLGLPVLPDGCLEQMARVSHAIAEIANIAPDTHQAYVGAAAFAHKAGLHASAIKVDPLLYNHVDPSVVGNDMRILVTEMAGRASIELKSRELGLDLAGHPEAADPGHQAGQGAGGGRLVLRGRRRLLRAAGPRRAAGRSAGPPFTLESYRVLVEHREDGAVVSEATVKVRVRGERVIATAEGNGPVNALDEALRVALSRHYPELRDFELADYKVRILEGSHGTGAVTRVLVETADGAAGTGPPSACTRTSSRPAGTPWSTPSPTAWPAPRGDRRLTRRPDSRGRGGGGGSARTGRWSLPGRACTVHRRGPPIRWSTRTWSMVTGGMRSPSYGPQVPIRPGAGGVGGVDVTGAQQGPQRLVVEGRVEVAGEDPQATVRGGRWLGGQVGTPGAHLVQRVRRRGVGRLDADRGPAGDGHRRVRLGEAPAAEVAPDAAVGDRPPRVEPGAGGADLRVELPVRQQRGEAELDPGRPARPA